MRGVEGGGEQVFERCEERESRVEEGRPGRGRRLSRQNNDSNLGLWFNDELEGTIEVGLRYLSYAPSST